MTTLAGVGLSHDRNPVQAGKEAVLQASGKLQDRVPDLFFVFSTVGYDQPTLLQSIREHTGDTPLCGCSGEGVIALGEADESSFSVGVMAIASDDLQFSTLFVDGGPNIDSLDEGTTLAGLVNGSGAENPLALFVFPDPFTFNYDRFVRGYEMELETEKYLPLIGGLAADGFQFEKTYQYRDDRIMTHGISAVLVSGKGEIHYQVNHGSRRIGMERIITKSSGNRIYELDGKPVLEVLAEYVPAEEIKKWDEVTISLCLGFEASAYAAGESGTIIRALQQKNDAEGYVMINTERELEEGTKVWLTHRDPPQVRAGVDKMVAQLKQKMNGREPSLVLNFDCSGRGKLLFSDEQKKEMTRVVQDSFGPDIPWLGLYVYGELCPVNGHFQFHNYTGVIAAII